MTEFFFLYILLPLVTFFTILSLIAAQRQRRYTNRRRMASFHALITEGKIEEATAAVTAAAAKARYREPASQYQLAILFFRLRNYQETLDRIDRLGHLEQPAAGAIFRVRHAALMGLGRTTESMTMLEDSDRSRDSLEWRTSWLMHTPPGGYLDDQHMLIATEVLAGTPTDPVALSVATRGALDRRRWDEAARYARRLIEVWQGGQLGGPRLQLGCALFGARDVMGAEAQFALIRKEESAEVVAMIDDWKVVMLLRDGRFDEAATLARQFVRDRPGESRAHFLLASALWRTGDLDRAEREFDAAKEAGVGNDSRELEALLLADRGRGREAEKLAVAVDDPTGFCLAYVRCKLGLAGAEEALRHHLEAIPTDADNEILLALPAPGGGTWGDRITA
jgi:tetratricopeptide (TPR) repeat protein